VKRSPRPATRQRVAIFRLDAGKSVTFDLIGTQIHGFDCHWDSRGNRTVECEKPENPDCPGCLGGWPERWRGYIDCLNRSLKERGFLELTPEAALRLETEVGGPERLRGAVVTLTRGRAKTSRITVQLMGFRESTLGELPLEKDPEPMLRVFYAMATGR